MTYRVATAEVRGSPVEVFLLSLAKFIDGNYSDDPFPGRTS